MEEEDLLAEQRDFYRARAPTYDEWWQRRGRYDRGREAEAEWHRQVAVLDSALDAFGVSGSVIELAGGTGWWTQRLAASADHLTVVDASPEALDINRQRVGRDDIDYVVADLFDWRPSHFYDVVFFSFWLSHVPRSRARGFWALVHSCLAADGRVFFIDGRTDPTPEIPKDPYVVQYNADRDLRRLDDGSEYSVVRVMYEPDYLQRLLDAQGWEARVEATRWFIFGSARPR